MATKTKRQVTKKKEVEPLVLNEEVLETSFVTEKPKRKWLPYLLLVTIVLVLFWQRTNTWPIAAIVNGRPVLRHELNQELYKQGGPEVLDSIITQRLVDQEIAKSGVQASAEEVDARISEIKTTFGESYQAALDAQGITETELRDQISTQLAIERLLSDQATVSAEEIDAAMEQDPAADAAETEKFLKQQKLQTAISTWVDEIREKAKIYVVGQKETSETPQQ